MVPTILLTLAILICFAFAGILLWKAYQEHKKQTDQKGFIIIGSVLLFCLFPSAALTILGIVFLCVLLKILF